MNTSEFLDVKFAENKTVDINIDNKKFVITFKGEIDSADITAAVEIARQFCFEDGRYNPARRELALGYCLLTIFTDIEIDVDDSDSVDGLTTFINNYPVYEMIRDNIPTHPFKTIVRVFNDAISSQEKISTSVLGIIDEIKGLDFRGMFGDDVMDIIDKLSDLDDESIINGILKYHERGVGQNQTT